MLILAGVVIMLLSSRMSEWFELRLLLIALASNWLYSYSDIFLFMSILWIIFLLKQQFSVRTRAALGIFARYEVIVIGVDDQARVHQDSLTVNNLS